MRFFLPALILPAVVVTAPPEGSPRVTGHWEVSVTSQERTFQGSLDLWRDAGGRLTGSADVAGNGFYGLPVTPRLDGNRLSLTIGEGSRPALVEVTVSDDHMAGSFQGLGGRAKVVGTRTGSQSARVEEEEIEIKAAGATLAGTLLKPDTPGPWPAVVLVHGSGKQTRGGQDYRSLAVFLARQGVAALVYDRRGKGASTGEADRILPMDVLANDALTALETVGAHADVDATRLGLLGISQGGWVTPLAASRSPKVAFVIVLSAAGVPPDRQNAYAVLGPSRQILRSSLERTGMPPDTLEVVLAREGRFQEEIERARQPEEAPEVVPGFSRFDPASVWTQVRVPVLALWGARDEVVPGADSRKIIETALRSAGNRDVTLVTLPQADHQLRVVPQTGENWDWPRMSPDRDPVLTRWIAGHLQRPSSR